MAEKLMNIVNFHSSGSVAPNATLLVGGEIAVVHPNKKEAALYTKVGENELAKFISEDAVNTKISESIVGLIESIGNPSDESEKVEATGLYLVIENLQKQVASLKEALEASNDETYKLKGSVETLEALEAIENPKKGDSYNVAEDGSNYVWDGEKWDSMARDAEDNDAVIDSIKDIFK